MEMLRKRSVDESDPTFPAQALPWSGSTGIISAVPERDETLSRSWA